MDSRGSREIIQLNRHFAAGDSNLHVLPDAGHQLFMNNPTGFAELLTADLTGQLKNIFQPQKYRVRYITLQGEPMTEFDDPLFPEAAADGQEESKEPGVQQADAWENSEANLPSQADEDRINQIITHTEQVSEKNDFALKDEDIDAQGDRVSIA